MKTLSQRFASFAAATSYPDIPASARDRARIHLLDTLGAAIAGSASREAAISREVAASSPGDVPLWGTPATSAPLAAAFGNGVAAHAFELDDSGGCDHSGAVVVPALFAAAASSETPVSGRTAIEAVVLGYEIARRVQSALGGYDELNERGWHSTGVCGTFGAAVAAGRILGLDAGQLGHAIGLAGSFTGGTWAFLGNGAMSKRMHVGRAAETGLHCALLARSGFTGPDALFEARWGGFLGLYGGDGADPGALVADLGTDWQVEHASIKPYASCRSTHAAIDALLEVMAEHTLKAEQLAGIEVRTSPLIVDMCGGRGLESLVAAQLSMPFALATAALRGTVALENMAAEGRSDASVRDLMDRVAITVDPAQSGGSAAPLLRIQPREGGLIQRRAGTPLGAWTNRLPDAATVDKFRALAGARLPGERVERLAELVLGIENVDLAAIARTLATDTVPEIIS